MKSYVKTSLILGLICAFCASLLVLVNNFTEDKISSNELKELNSALNKVSSNYEIGERINLKDTESVSYYYELYSSKSNKTVAGYILGLEGYGYGGLLTLLASYKTDGSIIAVQLVSNSETPGVGKKAEKEGYMDMFLEKGDKVDIPLNKNQLSDPDRNLVSGATMTFTAISKALNNGSMFVKTLGDKK